MNRGQRKKKRGGGFVMISHNFFFSLEWIGLDWIGPGVGKIVVRNVVLAYIHTCQLFHRGWVEKEGS